MNVEQRHDAQGNIFFGKSVGVRDICRGNREIEMPQRHALGTTSASAGVQDQGYVVSFRLGCGNTSGRTHQVNIAVCTHFHRKNWNLAIEGCAARKFRADWRAKQDAGVSIAEKEKKFFIRV